MPEDKDIKTEKDPKPKPVTADEEEPPEIPGGPPADDQGEQG